MSAEQSKDLTCIQAVMAAGIVLLISGCSASTRLEITIDTLSFLDEAARSVEIVVPSAQPLVIYLFPGLEVEESGTPPNDLMALGILIDLPGDGKIPEGAELTCSIRSIFRFTNSSGLIDFPGGSVDAYIAPSASTDIYSDGERMTITSLPPIAAGETLQSETVITFDQASPEFDVITSGAFRIGTMIALTPDPSDPILLDVGLIVHTIDFGLRPWGLIP